MKKTFGPHTTRLVVRGKGGAIATFSRTALNCGATFRGTARQLGTDFQATGSERVLVNRNESAIPKSICLAVRLDGNVLDWNGLPLIFNQFGIVPPPSVGELQRFNEAGRIPCGMTALSRALDDVCAQEHGFSRGGHNGHYR